MTNITTTNPEQDPRLGQFPGEYIGRTERLRNAVFISKRSIGVVMAAEPVMPDRTVEQPPVAAEAQKPRIITSTVSPEFIEQPTPMYTEFDREKAVKEKRALVKDVQTDESSALDTTYEDMAA